MRPGQKEGIPAPGNDARRTLFVCWYFFPRRLRRVLLTVVVRDDVMRVRDGGGVMVLWCVGPVVLHANRF